MNKETAKTILIPGHWESPKYSLGLMVKRGQIIGIEYHPPGTRIAYELGKGWSYTVMLDEFEEDTEITRESDIKPASSEQLQAKINSLRNLIDACQSNIAILTQQLEEVQQA